MCIHVYRCVYVYIDVYTCIYTYIDNSHSLSEKKSRGREEILQAGLHSWRCRPSPRRP